MRRPGTARSPGRWLASWGLPEARVDGAPRDPMANTRWTRFRRRVRYWWSHRRRERWLSEEIGFHLDAMVEDLVARGVPEREASAQARRKFGDMTRTVEDARATWIARWMSDLVQDLR